MKMIKDVKDILKPFGCLDVLYYYSVVSDYLGDFLKGKEVATKTLLPKGIFLKRGSNTKPLFINDMKSVNEEMLRLRAEHGLGDVREKLTKQQELVWEYFVPRKLIHFFYATNNEHYGKNIERVFIDIDKGKEIESDVAREVTRALIDAIKNDVKLTRLVKYEIKVLWTGNSFHVYLMLKKDIALEDYTNYFAYSKNDKLKSFIGRWSEEIKRATGIDVEGGHEKTEKHIVLDPSGTPSGKLARAPFSLHLKNAGEIDGVAVPVSESDLADSRLIRKLQKLTPQEIIKNIEIYSRILK